MAIQADKPAQLRNALQRIASLRLQGKDGYEAELAQLLSHDVATLEKWSAPLSKEEREARNNAIFDHWLAGETVEEIASTGKLGHSQIANIIKSSSAFKRDNAGISEQPPIYNVWNYSSCDTRFGQKHPGQIPGQAVLNLVLWLTDPFDVVADPMGGGGTTIDVCRYALRRYYCFDIDPRRPDIKRHNIRQGYPKLPHKPHLIILDPPYWRLKRDEYSEDGAAMTSYQQWLDFMAKLAKDSFSCVKEEGHVALFIESFLDERETGRFLFLNRDCLELFESAGFEGIQEIAVNMPSQIKSFRDVTYAKKRRILLDLKREVFVFKKCAHRLK